MRKQQCRADELRIGDRVIDARGHPLAVTSTRLQGVGCGMVSVAFGELGERVTYRPSEVVQLAGTSGLTAADRR
jgi:hypothetical protein